MKRVSYGTRKVFSDRESNSDGFSYNYGGKFNKFGPLPKGKGQRSKYRNCLRSLRADKKRIRKIDLQIALNED